VHLKCDLIHDSQCSEFGLIKISGIAAALSVTKFMKAIALTLVTPKAHAKLKL